MIYKFKDGFQVAGDAQEVGETVERLRLQHGGRLTPVDVVEEAAKRRSALNRYFEWDDTAAARKYRLSQAGYLIRAVVMVAGEDVPPFEPVRAFVCISGSEEQPRSFTHVCEAMRDEQVRDQVITRAKTELRAWRKRYADLTAFAEVFGVIDQLPAA